MTIKYANTVDSRYYDTVGMRKNHQNIQTIDIIIPHKIQLLASDGILKMYHDKQYFDISDIVITRDHCVH